MKKYLAVLIALVMLLAGCGADSGLSEEELAVINDICAAEYTEDQLEDVTESMLADGRDKKFAALQKIYKLPNGYYAFFANPVGYNGEIYMAVVLDGEKSVAIRILEHIETDHYVRDFDTASWFVDRFKDKDISEYLEVVRLNANADNEIVSITGSTITAQAVVNGVNSAFGAYTEAILGGTAEAVDSEVDFSDYDREGLG